VAAGLSAVGFVIASVRVSAPSRGLSEEVPFFDLGWNWIPLTLAVLLLVFGAFRLTRRDSQARGFLIVGGGGLVAFALWEMLTIQDRAIAAAASLADERQAAFVRETLHRFVAEGVLSISVNIGIYLVLAAGILALGAVALCFVPASPAAPVVPATPAPPAPSGSLEAAEVPVASAANHPAGERCSACQAILGEETNVCWYCGRLWSPLS
jgi:hypothetical protein